MKNNIFHTVRTCSGKIVEMGETTYSTLLEHAVEKL
jgi:hypothetical protein